ncbi:hypothetical protein COP1_047309 [Malus domestica]
MAKMPFDIFFAALCLARLVQRDDAFTHLGHASVIVIPACTFSTFPLVSISPSQIWASGLQSTFNSLSLALHLHRKPDSSTLSQNLQVWFRPFYPNSQSSAQNLENIGLCFRLHPLSWDRSLRAFCVHPSEATAFTVSLRQPPHSPTPVPKCVLKGGLSLFMPIFMTHKALTELGFVCLVTWIAQVRLERMEVEIQLGKIKKDFMFEVPREFGIEKLREATHGFRENSLIEGSVYKGFMNGDFFAIQKMKWNACEVLKILHKRSRTSQAIRCDPRYQRQRLHSKCTTRKLRHTGGNWWTSEGKRGGNSLIHSSMSQKLWFIYRMLEEPSSRHMLRVTKVALWVIRLQRYYGNLMHTITVGLSHSLTPLFLEC